MSRKQPCALVVLLTYVLCLVLRGHQTRPYREARHVLLPIFNEYEMFNVWATVFTIVHLPRMFPPTDLKKRIGLVSIYLLYIIFTYYTQDN